MSEKFSGAFIRELRKKFGAGTVVVKSSVIKMNMDDFYEYVISITDTDNFTCYIDYTKYESAYCNSMANNKIIPILADEAINYFNKRKESEQWFNEAGYEEIKDKLYPVIVDTVQNTLFIDEKVNREFMSLSVLAAYDMTDSNNQYLYTEYIYQKDISRWNVSADEVIDQAIANDKHNSVYTFINRYGIGIINILGHTATKDDQIIKNINDTISDYNKDTFLLCSNSKFKASVLLNEEFIQSVAETIGHDFYVMPMDNRGVIIETNIDKTLDQYYDIVGMTFMELKIMHPEHALTSTIFRYRYSKNIMELLP